MFARVLKRDAGPRRLRLLLALLFLALAVPTGLVVWQAYSQLKWESFHQYRSRAEELTQRVDQAIGERIAAAEARRFADYAFINVGGEPQSGVLQRSVLSAFPVEPQLPGLIGYFQVDAEGRFSTPLLPGPGIDLAAVGIGAEEYRARAALTREIGRILAENRLVGDRALAAAGGAAAPAAPGTAGPGLEPISESRPEELPEALSEVQPELEEASGRDGSGEAWQAVAEGESELRQAAKEDDAQRMFDRLSSAPVADAAPVASEAAANEPGEAFSESRAEPWAQPRANVLGKVQDLRLDEALNRKSEILEQADAVEEKRKAAAPAREGGERSRRLEQTALAEPIDADRSADLEAPSDGLRITAFESEVDPFEFSLLGSGHFVLFRKVWRNGERYIQGALIEHGAFLDEVLTSDFRATALHGMSDLVVAYRDDVIEMVPAAGRESYAAGASGMRGALLYRGRLSAPLDALELIYSINRLPPGPGAAVLGWTTLLLAAVLVGGFFLLYRLGLRQIALARQQQDFVSAVSHELKTPLTSIRMYGEMLREGWADEDRRRQYYAYIHDESERLSRLIDNVLRLASISRNGLDLDLQPMPAGALVERIHSKIAGSVERAGFELAVELADEARDAEIAVDEDCFAQIVINLVDNAIKFSRNAETRRIELALAPARDGRLRFSVRDFGPGVPRDQLKKIFRMFYRTESELTRETVGTGIGLAIVHQLVTAMAGKVDVVNRSPGAEFGVSFPVIHQG